MLEEKERLKEEWSLFKEQKKNFERERRSFTEAAIRLGLEVSSAVLGQHGCAGDARFRIPPDHLTVVWSLPRILLRHRVKAMESLYYPASDYIVCLGSQPSSG